jgi:osmoprotectant transport system ATP-binding protein
MISLKDVSKRFGEGSYAVSDLSLDIEQGETVVLVGPSGCGKTTTLKMINRLVEPTSGSIVVNGRDVMEQDPVQMRRSVGYVIQSIGLMPHRTIFDNVATVPRLLGWDRSRIARRVTELMEMFQLDRSLLERYPGELSGGQRQRVGVARALAADPPVMLMDEPFGAVDPIIRGRLQEEFLDIQRELRKTIVFVTHDVDEAIKMADRIAILNVGGVLEQYGEPRAILASPANGFVASFLGSERALKRLALIPVADVAIERGPAVDVHATVDQALKEMESHRTDWVNVIDGDELLGWTDRERLEGLNTVDQADRSRVQAYVSPASSLRKALDSIVTARTQSAVVLDGDRYVGTVNLAMISREILS